MEPFVGDDNGVVQGVVSEVVVVVSAHSNDNEGLRDTFGEANGDCDGGIRSKSVES